MSESDRRTTGALVALAAGLIATLAGAAESKGSDPLYRREVVSPAVLFGPCRAIANRPATFTLPVTRKARLSADEAARLAGRR